jgi:hypothetical protein
MRPNVTVGAVFALAQVGCSRGAPMGDAEASRALIAASEALDSGAELGIPSAAIGARIEIAQVADDAEPPASSPAVPLYGAVPFVGTPKIREGALSLSNGGLSRDVVQRILRKSFARVRLCYENGLRGNPSLAGMIRVRFVIESNGSVGTATDAGSSVADPAVVRCAVSGFDSLEFPTPSTSAVVGVYTIYLDPPPP